MVTCSAISGLYIAEIGLYIVGWTRPAPKEITLAEKNLTYDRRTKFEVIQDLNKKGLFIHSLGGEIKSLIKLMFFRFLLEKK